MTPQAIVKARWMEAADQLGVVFAIRNRQGAFYANLRGEPKAVDTFVARVMPSAQMTSGSGGPDFSDLIYRLDDDAIRQLLDRLQFDPECLKWNDSTPLKIAQSIRTERTFDRLPILADALEEAGCDNDLIMKHCRNAAVHARSCWVIELLLGTQRKGRKLE